MNTDRCLATIAHRIRQSLNLEEILNTTVVEIQQLLKTDRVLIYRFEPDWSGIITAESVSHNQFSMRGTIIKDACFEKTWLDLYKQGFVKAIQDIYTAGLSSCYVEFLAQYQVRANLVVPILQREEGEKGGRGDGETGQQAITNSLIPNRLWGVLIAHHCSEPRKWQPSEIDFLEKLATQVAIAIQQSTLFEQVNRELAERKRAEAALQKAKDELENKVQERTEQLEQINKQLQGEIAERKQAEKALQLLNNKLNSKLKELEKRNREMTLLSEMSEFLQACSTLEEAYKIIPTLIQTLFPNSSGGVFIIKPSKNLVEAVATWETPLASDTMFAPHECWALRRGRPHWVEDMQTGLLCSHLHQSPHSASSLCVPMIAQGETLGMLYLSYLNSSKSGRLTKDKQQLTLTVAEQAALALANLKLRETLHYQSICDPLTGLFNRRYMEESLKREIIRAQRRKKPIGIILLDVDHFRRFNNRFGHQAGDAVLRELGFFLQRNIRGSDVACRYGGEEFMLILSEAPLENTRQRAEQLREGVKHLNVENHDQSFGAITISVGVACFPEHGETGEAVIKAADVALYNAKKEGRDRTVVYNT